MGALRLVPAPVMASDGAWRAGSGRSWRDAREVQPASTFGATSANRSSGSPTARIAPSLNVSCPIVFTLTLPGSSRIAANTSTPVTSAAPNSVPASSGAASSSSPGSAARAISASIRATASAGIRPAIRMVSDCSACRIAVPMIRRTRSRAGGSIRSPFRCASNSSRSRSTWRSFSHTFAASHSAALSASATEHSRNPKYLRTSAR